MNEYTIAPRARRDISAVYRYIAQDNISAADNWLSQLYDRFGLIAQNPQIGRLRPDLMPEVRAMSLGSYVIFFRPHNNAVEIVRVIHGARDISAAFLGR